MPSALLMGKVKCLSRCLRKMYATLCMLSCVYVKTPLLSLIISFTGHRKYVTVGVVCCYIDRVLQKEANGFGDARGIWLKSFRVHLLARSVRVSESLLAVRLVYSNRLGAPTMMWTGWHWILFCRLLLSNWWLACS